MGRSCKIAPPEVTDCAFVRLNADAKEISEQLEMRSCPEEAFIESNEIGNMEYSVRRNMMQLPPIKPEEAAHKVVERKSKPLLKYPKQRTCSPLRGVGGTSPDGSRTFRSTGIRSWSL